MLGDYSKVITARWLQQGDYSKVITARWLQQGDYSKVITARWLQQGDYSKVITARWLQQGDYSKTTGNLNYVILERLNPQNIVFLFTRAFHVPFPGKCSLPENATKVLLMYLFRYIATLWLRSWFWSSSDSFVASTLDCWKRNGSLIINVVKERNRLTWTDWKINRATDIQRNTPTI